MKKKTPVERFRKFREKWETAISCTLVILAIVSWIFLAISWLPSVSYNVNLAVTTSITAFFVMLLLDHVLSIKNQYNGDISIYTDVPEFFEKITDNHSPKKVDLIEYSTESIRRELLLKLMAHKIQIRLLICDPGAAIPNRQREKICYGISELCKFNKKNKSSDLKMKCYAFPASLRGRNFDDKFVEVGWYTYYNDPNNDLRIRGDDNITIGASITGKAGTELHAFFKKCFEEMWNPPEPVEATETVKVSKPLNKVCGKLDVCEKCPVSSELNWLKAVS